MSWLNAYESFFIDVLVRDRLNDLLSTIDVATARSEQTDETRAVPDAGPACGWVCRRAVAEASR
jgi:hypothetical protein